MKRTNKYLDNLVTKIINETLEEKADQVMAKLGGSDDFDYVAEGETCKCGSKEFYEGMCVECGTMKGDIFEKECMEGGPGCMGEGKTHELDEFEDEDWLRATDEIAKELDRSQRMSDKSSERRSERRIRHKQVDDEAEMEEGNAFTDALRKTPKGGKFKLGGKEYTDNSSLDETLYRLSDDKGFELFTEDEIIDLIENIVIEEKTKSNIKSGTEHKGLTKYKEVHKKDGKENEDALKAVVKKMTDYVKVGSKGKYETNPDRFPQGNGQLDKMDKKAYEVSNDGEEFIDNFLRPGMQTLDYDEMHPNEDWMDDIIQGSQRTGNSDEYANAEKTEVNKKLNKTRKKNPYNKAKRAAYNKAPQPVITDKPGQETGKGLHLKLESVEDKKSGQLNEEFERMKGLISYDRKTQ
jgi:hypothetical protein